MPNSSPALTRARTGRLRPSVPSSMLAMTDRALRGRPGPSGSGLFLRSCFMCRSKCNIRAMAVTMLPPSELLPDVLPTDRLSKTGRPVPAVREELRRISDARSVLTVLGVYLQSFGIIALALWIGQPWAYAAAFLLMGRAHCMYNILGHEAAHRLLFTSKRANDVVGRWLLAYLSFQPLDLY